MRVKYIGKTTISLSLAIGPIPSLTKDKIYNVILDNEKCDCYTIIDDDGIRSTAKKELFEIIDEIEEVVSSNEIDDYLPNNEYEYMNDEMMWGDD